MKTSGSMGLLWFGQEYPLMANLFPGSKSLAGIICLLALGSLNSIAHGQSSTSGRSTGSFSGGGFSGGSSMGSSMGSSFGSSSSMGGGSFVNTGQGSFTGGGFSFTGGGTGFGSVGNSRNTGNQSVGSSSFLGQFMASPQGLGYANQTFGAQQNTTFGQPLVGSSGATGAGRSSAGTRGGRTTGSSMFGGMGIGSRGTGSTSTFTGMGGATARVNSYVTEPIFDLPSKEGEPGPNSPGIVPTRVKTEAQDILSRSPRFQGDYAVTVDSRGPAVVLRGTVPSPREKRIAETMVRLTPGVRQIINELEVAKDPE
jgi:hypothetical protein